MRYKTLPQQPKVKTISYPSQNTPAASITTSFNKSLIALNIG